MKILCTKSFTKKYWKLPEMLRQNVDNTITTFRKDPFAPSLHNHALKGAMKGQRSLSAGFDHAHAERDGDERQNDAEGARM